MPRWLPISNDVNNDPAEGFAVAVGESSHAPPDGSADLRSYDYPLPDHAIAQTPLDDRSAARLLVDLARSGDPDTALTVRSLPALLERGDVVVVNDTKVLPARLSLFKPTGGAAEVLLLEPDGDPVHNRWVALVRPGRRIAPGTVLVSADGRPVVEVGEPHPAGDGQRQVVLLDDIESHGAMPLPPYIHEPLVDPDRYQTVYASAPGSVAAPTAGLHLTHDVLAAIEARGAAIHRVDLAVGLGTFRPIETPDVGHHRMHTERYRVPAETLEACRSATGRVLAVGTTSLRALESAAIRGESEGRTDLYIQPGYRFQVVDTLLTNFHLPKSSLLVLLAAFAGAPRWRSLYETALAEKFRFLSFGDAMLVSREQ